MFRFLAVPVSIGILAFALVYFIFPYVFSAADIVAGFGSFALDLSNLVFTELPQPIADYLARLDLLKVAVSIALLLLVSIEALVLLGDILILVSKALLMIFKRKPKPARPRDLPPLELGASPANARPGNKILGGGFDSLDPD